MLSEFSLLNIPVAIADYFSLKPLALLSLSRDGLSFSLSCSWWGGRGRQNEVSHLFLSLAQWVLVKLATFPSPLLSIQCLCIVEYS